MGVLKLNIETGNSEYDSETFYAEVLEIMDGEKLLIK